MLKPLGGNWGTRFEPGTDYRGELPAAGVTFDLRLTQEGWRVVRPQVDAVDRGALLSLENHSQRAGVVLILWMPNEPIATVADWFARNERVIDSTAPASAIVAGLDAVQLDVLISPDPVQGALSLCSGVELSGGFGSESLLACTWNRIWVVNVEGISVTIIASAGRFDGDGLDPDGVPWQITDFVAQINDVVEGLTFCTDTTPCNPS